MLRKRDSPLFFDQQRRVHVCRFSLAASPNRVRLSPFEGPAIESPRLCRGTVTYHGKTPGFAGGPQQFDISGG